jgi:sugar lactone lactonase YvrE
VPSKSLAFRPILAIPILALLSLIPSATAQKVFTVAGGYVGDGKPATSAALNFPQFAAYDLQGNLLTSDMCRVRKVNTRGIISTIAGTGICGFSGDGGLATHAKVATPSGIAVDSSGNIFFADSFNQRVRKIDGTGTITTLAGNGKAKYCGDGKIAVKACLNSPAQLAIGSGGAGEVLYIADFGNQRIRQVVLRTDVITTVAGNGTPGYSGDGGPARKASLHDPWGVAFDGKTRTLWISDAFNAAIRQVDLRTGIITTFLGSLGLPVGLITDESGNLHVADVFAPLVEEITVPGRSKSVDAGVLGPEGFNGDGIPANTAFLSSPYGVAVSPAGDLLTLDTGNSRIRKGSGSHLIATVAGGYIGDGKAAISAAINIPQALAFDKLGNLFIADTFNHRIRKVDTSAMMSTFAGNGISRYSGDGGPAQKASLYFPDGVAADVNGSVFIADFGNGVIRKVDKSGIISTFAQEPVAGVTFMTTDSAGNLYVADTNLCTIFKFGPDGTSSVVAGTEGQCGFNEDGIPATQALLNGPYGVALDSKGNLYIGDSSNNRVRMVDTSGIIHTIAGNGTCGFSGDGGPGTGAMLCSPTGVAVDAKGNLYVADWLNYRVRRVDAAGTIQTIAGTGNYLYNGNGLPARKTNMSPFSIAVSPSGEVHVADNVNEMVRKIQ